MANGMRKKKWKHLKEKNIFLFTRNEAYALVWFLNTGRKSLFFPSTLCFCSHKKTQCGRKQIKHRDVWRMTHDLEKRTPMSTLHTYIT